MLQTAFLCIEQMSALQQSSKKTQYMLCLLVNCVEHFEKKKVLGTICYTALLVDPKKTLLNYIPYLYICN